LLSKVANQEDTDGQPRPPQNHKPPPIFIHGVINYGEMIKHIIRDVAEDEKYCTKSLANNVIKLNCTTPETYRNLFLILRCDIPVVYKLLCRNEWTAVINTTLCLWLQFTPFYIQKPHQVLQGKSYILPHISTQSWTSVPNSRQISSSLHRHWRNPPGTAWLGTQRPQYTKCAT